MAALHLATVVAMIASAILGSRVLALGLPWPRVRRADQAARLRRIARDMRRCSAGAAAQERRP